MKAVSRCSRQAVVQVTRLSCPAKNDAHRNREKAEVLKMFRIADLRGPMIDLRPRRVGPECIHSGRLRTVRSKRNHPAETDDLGGVQRKIITILATVTVLEF